MAFYQSIRTDKESLESWEKYKRSLKSLSNGKLIDEFFSYLDLVEESDSGREFHPVQISSVRVQLSQPLNAVLAELKKRRQPEENKVYD